jgi:FkbM family methyltransferase
MSISRRFAEVLLTIFSGRKIFQGFFEFLHLAGIYGMNYGNGGDFRTSGEFYAIRHARTRLKRTAQPYVIFDVGANVGNYSREVSAYFSSVDFRLYSFEPSVVTFKKLIETTAAIPQIIPENIGFGDEIKQVLLYADKDTSGFASVYQRDLAHSGIFLNQTEEIKLTTIDAYCTRHGIEHIHFLKLDVEGHEFNALKGASAMLRDQKIAFIQFEFGGTSIDARTYFHDFWNLLHDQYTLYRIVKDGLVPIPRYSERLELFMAINYLAERRN